MPKTPTDNELSSFVFTRENRLPFVSFKFLQESSNTEYLDSEITSYMKPGEYLEGARGISLTAL